MPTDTPPRRNWLLTRWLIVFIVAVFGWGGWRAYAFRSTLSQAKALGWIVEYTDPVETVWKNWKAAFEKETWLDGVTNVRIPTSEAFEKHLAIVHRLNPKGLVIDNASTLRDLSALSPLNGLLRLGLTNATKLTNVDALNNLTALQTVWLNGCTGLTNLDGLKNLTALQFVYLSGCTALINVDGLQNLSTLQFIDLSGCTGLTNLDALKNLSALQTVWLYGCTGLTSVDALKNLTALQQVYLNGCTGLAKESVAALKAALPRTNIYSDYD